MRQGERPQTTTADRRAWGQAAASLLRSGLLTPAPLSVGRMARMLWRHGATAATPLALAAARYPNRVAVVDDCGSITFAELYARASSAAARLQSERSGARSSIAVLCRNHRGFAVAFATGVLAGGEVILMNTELPQDQLEALLERHSPDVLIHDPEYSDVLAGIASRSQLIRSDRLLVDSPVDLAFTPSRRPVKLTLLTSGTTGLAKGVPRSMSVRGIVELAATGLARFGIGPADTVWIGPPFFHGFGILTFIGAIASGATVVCRPKFDGAAAIDDMVRHRVTVLVGVPTMLQRILDVPEPSTGATGLVLRLAITGAAPIRTDTIVRFQRRFGPILLNGYGSTEAGLIAIASADELAESPDSVGRPALGVEIRIAGDTDEPCLVGRRGRILVRGALGYSGYTPDPQSGAPHKKKEVDGFVDTGDVGYLDDAGRLYLVGRSDDMIVSGGENVFPTEVENVLSTHPGVADVVVIGVPDEQYGQVLHAYVVAARADLTDAELKAHLVHRIERYKTPKRFQFVSAIARNPSGKVLRSQLPKFAPYDEDPTTSNTL